MTGRKIGSKNTATMLLERAADDWATYADEHPTASAVEIGSRFGVNAGVVHTYLTRRGFNFSQRRAARGEATRQARASTRTVAAVAATTPPPLDMAQMLSDILSVGHTIERKLDRCLSELGVSDA